jgi:hypothetical protein
MKKQIAYVSRHVQDGSKCRGEALLEASGSVTTEASPSGGANDALATNQEGRSMETKLFAWSCQRAWTMLIFYTNSHHT